MAHYETHIGKVTNSTFAVGENAAAYSGVPADPKYQDLARRLDELVGLLAENVDVTNEMAEMRSLAGEAQSEVIEAPPDKQRLQRLLGSMRAVLQKAGPGVVGAGAVADAVAKIAGAIQHL